ncbi:hypothetical protein COLAER_02396 [Collinsella aerofaciens ATCC 25986]|uniref:Uncharacterized protein n=1 Tax=Collinsella aerofaciens (strain ATCC 25986 / DSM 3979 / JCM 10188 / KCTC 3647 / NCTC 11838 / VPI 1003) TaxID=411903 RepID=A4ED55_COLAA|nr:hypothetical protein COLAER_02396 [Collinsella aerofaciens ATCC 25986]
MTGDDTADGERVCAGTINDSPDECRDQKDD